MRFPPLIEFDDSHRNGYTDKSITQKAASPIPSLSKGTSTKNVLAIFTIDF